MLSFQGFCLNFETSAQVAQAGSELGTSDIPVPTSRMLGLRVWVTLPII